MDPGTFENREAWFLSRLDTGLDIASDRVVDVARGKGGRRSFHSLGSGVWMALRGGYVSPLHMMIAQS